VRFTNLSVRLYTKEYKIAVNRENTILGIFLILILTSGWVVGLWLSHVDIEQTVKQQNTDK
jgi:hypothetical protein